ncbi:MAG: hypothetical protein NTY23_02035 [Chloroflexi bacterium]|nr:hypothetical protein [Chloroflexota bacterium]
MTVSRTSTPGPFAKFLAVLFILLFSVTTPLVVLGLVARGLLFNPAFYKRALAQADVYRELPRAVASQLAASVVANPPEATAGAQGEGEPGLGAVFAALPPQLVESLMVRLIPPDWMQAQVEGVIDQVVAYLDHGQGAPTLTISLAEVKTNLRQGALESALREVIAGLPPCTAEQLLTFGGEVLSGQSVVLPACQPPQVMTEVFIATATFTAEGMLIRMLPDELNLMQPFGPAGAPGTPLPFMQGLDQLLGRVRLAKRVAEISALVPLVLLALIALLTARTARLALRWLGAPLLTAGVLSALVGLALYLGFGILAATVPMSPGASGPTGLLGLAREVAQGMVTTFVLWVEAGAGAMMLAGLVMTGVAGSLRRREVG